LPPFLAPVASLPRFAHRGRHLGHVVAVDRLVCRCWAALEGRGGSPPPRATPAAPGPHTCRPCTWCRFPRARTEPPVASSSAGHVVLTALSLGCGPQGQSTRRDALPLPYRRATARTRAWAASAARPKRARGQRRRWLLVLAQAKQAPAFGDEQVDCDGRVRAPHSWLHAHRRRVRLRHRLCPTAAIRAVSSALAVMAASRRNRQRRKLARPP
jgi:hypothetical protein